MLVSTWGLLTESGWLKDHKEKDGQVYILKHLQTGKQTFYDEIEVMKKSLLKAF
jgi:hypothetical protein